MHSSAFLYRFSRRIVWLRVMSSNSDPRVVLHFFLEAIQNIDGNLSFLLLVIRLAGVHGQGHIAIACQLSVKLTPMQSHFGMVIPDPEMCINRICLLFVGS